MSLATEAAELTALGTGVYVAVTGGADLRAAVAAVERELAGIDLACSRFRPDSEISRVNAAAGRRRRVSALLVEAVTVALRAAELTGGAVDPTVGGALCDAGYSVDFADIPEDGPLRVVVRPVPGWRRVRLDAAAGTLQVPAGTVLDLGATAKALASDRAAAAAVAAAGGGVLVSCGGDIAVAGAAPEGGWTVRVAERMDDDAPGQHVDLETGGLATSGTTARRWRRGGRDMHHIIDPATGLPAEERWRAVSVAAATCVDANIAATAAIVLGDAAVGWLESTGLPARLVALDGGVVTVGGWPSGDDE